MVEKIKDTFLVAEFPEGEPIVSMIQFKDQILLATTRRVFRVFEGKVIPLVLKADPEEWNG